MVHEIRTLGLPALLSFHTVARCGGISTAAAELALSKSGVSRHVSQIEAHFGVRLLERGARSVRLTPVGARLDDRIRSILAEIDLLKDIVLEERSGVSGQVTIATTPEIGRHVATSLFRTLRSLYPELTLVMRPAYEFEDMQDPGTDLALRVGSFNDDRLVVRKLGAFQRWLVAAPALLDQYPLTDPNDLAAAPCLTFRGDRPGASWTLVGCGAETTVDVSGPIAVHSLDILHDLARAGEGFALLPSFMLSDALAGGDLVRCLPDHASQAYPVYLSFRPGARNIARIAAVIETTEALVPSLLPA